MAPETLTNAELREALEVWRAHVTRLEATLAITKGQVAQLEQLLELQENQQ